MGRGGRAGPQSTGRKRHDPDPCPGELNAPAQIDHGAVAFERRIESADDTEDVFPYEHRLGGGHEQVAGLVVLFLIQLVGADHGNPDPEAVRCAAEIAQRQAVVGVEQLGTGDADDPPGDVLGIVDENADGVGRERDAVGEEEEVVRSPDQRSSPIVDSAHSPAPRSASSRGPRRHRSSDRGGGKQLSDPLALSTVRVAQHQHGEPRVVLCGQCPQSEFGVGPLRPRRDDRGDRRLGCGGHRLGRSRWWSLLRGRRAHGPVTSRTVLYRTDSAATTPGPARLVR